MAEVMLLPPDVRPALQHLKAKRQGLPCSVPESKLLITDPDLQIENQGFRIWNLVKL